MADIRQRIVIDAVDNTSKGVRSAQRSASALETTFTRLRATLLGFVGLSIGADIVRSLARISDEAIELTAKLKLTTDSTEEFRDAFSTLFDLSVRTGTSFEANVTLFNRLRIAFTSAGSEAQNFALNLTEVLNNSLRISGASAQESASTIRQFSQAMASGVLRGEEFNAIMENSPRLVQALTDSLGVTVGELRKLSKEGLLSAEVVRDAILEQQDAIARQAAQLPLTIGRSFENLRSAYTAWITNFDEGNQSVAGAVNSLAENFDELADVITTAGRAAALYFGADALRAIGTRAAAFTAAKVAEATALQREIALQKEAEITTLATARVKAAAAAKATAEKLKQEAIEARIAANQKARAAAEEVAAAQAALLQARRNSLLAQYQAEQKKAQLFNAALIQEQVIAEKKAAVEIAVAREELRQRKQLAAQEEQLQAEARQLARTEELIQEKRLAVETAAIREKQRQEAEFDRVQRAKDAEIRRLQREEENVARRAALVEERRASLERAELQEIERQKREAIALRKKQLADQAVADNKREAKSIDELIAKMGIQFTQNNELIAQATQKQRTSLQNAEAKLKEAEATLNNVRAGEQEQVQTREGFVLNQEKIKQAQASATLDLEAAVAKRDLILAAQQEGITVAELTARRAQDNIAKIESTALDQERIAAVRAAASADVAAAEVKLQAINLAREQGITVAAATKQIQTQAVATGQLANVDRKAVLAATEKERARLRAARAAQVEAAAEVESAAATTRSNRATFIATDLTGVRGKAELLLAEKIRIRNAALAADTAATTQNTVARETNTIATELNTVANTANAASLTGRTAATVTSTAATTANTAATAANAAASGGLFATLKRILGTKVSFTGLFTSMSGSGSAAIRILGTGFGGLFSIIGRIGGALLGWPGIIAFVAYEIGKRFLDMELLGQSLGYAFERIGLSITNIFRGSEEAARKVQELQDEYDRSVDFIIRRRQAQAAGFQSAAEQEAAAAQELVDKRIRLETELVKKTDERIGKYAEYYEQLGAFEKERQEARKATLDLELDALDTAAELEQADLADRLQRQEDYQSQSEEIQRQYETRKVDLSIEAAQREVDIAKEQVRLVERELRSGNSSIREIYAERLELQRDANVTLVNGVSAALRQAASQERAYLEIAKGAAQQRKDILSDFNAFRRGILSDEADLESQYYNLSAERREANAKVREADRLKESGELEAASKLYNEAYDDLKNIADGYKELSENSELSRGEQERARLSLRTTISETGRAAQEIANVQSTIENNATENAELQAARQETLLEQLKKYQTELDRLDAAIDRDRTIRVELSTKDAFESIRRIDEAIKKLNQQVTVTVRQIEGNQIGGVIKRQSGGDIPDASAFKRLKNKVGGTGSGDIVPAMLEPGEFIVRKSAVQKYGLDAMYRLNNGMIPGFNAGGFLGSSSDVKPNRRQDALDEILNYLRSTIGRFEDLERKSQAAFGRGTIPRLGGKDRYLKFMTAKSAANIAAEYLPKFEGLDASNFSRAELATLKSAINALVNNKVVKGVVGPRAAKSLLGRRNEEVYEAKSLIAQILGSKSNDFSQFSFNTGGQVPGVGSGDTVRARLTPGEYVVRKNSVEKFGANFFESLNRGTLPRKYAAGGLVGGSVAGAETVNVNLTIGGKTATGSFMKDDATMAVLDQLKRAGAVS
jgi:tape measure domain-containing protein